MTSVVPTVHLISKPIIHLEGLDDFLGLVPGGWTELCRKVDSNLDLGDHDSDWIADFVHRFGTLDFRQGDHHSRMAAIRDICVRVMDHVYVGMVIRGISGLVESRIRSAAPVLIHEARHDRHQDHAAGMMPPSDLAALKDESPELYHQYLDILRRTQDFCAALHVRSRTPESLKVSWSVLPAAATRTLYVTMTIRHARNLASVLCEDLKDREAVGIGVGIFRACKQAAPGLLQDLAENTAHTPGVEGTIYVSRHGGLPETHPGD